GLDGHAGGVGRGLPRLDRPAVPLRPRIAQPGAADRLVLDARRPPGGVPGPLHGRRPLHQDAGRPGAVEEVVGAPPPQVKHPGRARRLPPRLPGRSRGMLHFKGTYTDGISGNPGRTFRYDSNQIRYRLDLDAEALRPALVVMARTIAGVSMAVSDWWQRW